MRDSLRRLYGALFCLLLLSSPVWANFLGVDAVPDTTCGPEDMVLEFAAGDVGSFVDVPIYLADMPNLLSLGCTICVKDKTLVTGETFTYNLAPWSTQPLANSDNAVFPISSYIPARYPDYRCYLLQGTDFSGTNPITVFPRVIGTLRFQVAQEGCLGFVIDGANSGWLSAGFLSGTFSLPSETCDTASCPSTVEPVAIDDVTPACPLDDAFIDEPYSGPAFTAIGGVPPYSWTQTGLPGGMDIGLNDGVVSGTPAQIGPFPFTVRVDDSDGGFATRSCSLFVIGYDVQVTALSDSPVGAAPGDVVHHVFEVHNTSNVSAPFVYDAGSTQGFTMTPDASGATLEMDARDTVGVDETIPNNPGCPVAGTTLYDYAYFGAALGFVKDGSKVVPSVSDVDTVEVQVAIAGAATLTALDTLRCGEPLSSVSFDIQVANDGACADTFDLSAGALDLPWNYYFNGSLPLVIPGGQSQQISFGVDIPDDAPCIERQRFSLAAVGRQFGSVARDTVKACAVQVYDGIATGPGNGFGEPGDTVEYCFQVKNTGNCPTFYRIDFSAGWAIDPVDGATTLEPGDSATFCTGHIIPAGAQSGDQDVLCGIVSLSAANPTKTFALPIDTLCVTTTVQVACQGGVDVTAWTNGTCHDPDSTFQAKFDVQNTGTCTEIFDLVAEVLEGPGWQAVAASPTVQVEAGSTAVVDVNVTVAELAQCGQFAYVRLTATGQNYGASDADTVQECTNAILDGTVTAPENQSGEPGEILTYCFEIENTGNCAGVFGVDFLAAWDHDPGHLDTLLAPGQSAILCATHTVPGDAQPGDPDTLCAVLAVGDVIDFAKAARSTIVDTACVVSTAIVPACEGGVDVSAYGGPYMGTPGGGTAIPFYVKNTGSQADQFAMNASANTGWVCSIQGPDTTVVLAVGDSTLVLVEVSVPQDAGCDVVADVELVALSLCDPTAYDSATNQLGVYPVCDWDVAAMTADTTAAPGQTMHYVFRVTNTGNCAATPVLSLYTDPASWVVVPPTLPTGIPAGDHADLVYELQVPGGAQEGDEHLLRLCALTCEPDGAGLLPPPPMDCDSTITRVLPEGCEQGQPILSLGGYMTLEYIHPNWVVQVEVKNAGPGGARNVNLDMNEDLEWLTIPDDHVFYGDLAQGASSYGMPADGFTFDLTNYPGGSFNVWFDVTYEDTCGTPYQVRLDPTFLDPTENGVPSPVAGGFALHQNRPNPFNPTTTISFDLPAAGQAELTIFNAAGQMVKRLWSGSLPQGTHSFTWSGDSERGTDVPSGTYFYSLKSGGRTETKRMVLVR